MGDLPENASKVKSVDGSCKTLKKEADAEICSSAEKTLAAEEHDSGCNKAKEVKEGGSVQVEVNNVFNGIPSPDMKPTQKTTYPSVLVKEKMSKVWERHHNCCNGNENVSDNCECQAKNGEAGISIKKREHQIKPGPTLSEDECGSSHSC